MRVPAFTAAIKEAGSLISKTVIPIPIQALTANTPTLNPLVASQHGITKPELPIRSKTVTAGKYMNYHWNSIWHNYTGFWLISCTYVELSRQISFNSVLGPLFIVKFPWHKSQQSSTKISDCKIFLIPSGLAIDSTAANLVPINQMASFSGRSSFGHHYRQRRQLLDDIVFNNGGNLWQKIAIAKARKSKKVVPTAPVKVITTRTKPKVCR